MGINIGENHGLDSWEFDEEGNLEIDSSYDNKDAFQTQGEKLLYGNLVELSLLANKLQANGGGLSSNEVVFLNNAQALFKNTTSLEDSSPPFACNLLARSDNKLQANGGGLSSNEVVFLNNACALFKNTTSLEDSPPPFACNLLARSIF